MARDKSKYNREYHAEHKASNNAACREYSASHREDGARRNLKYRCEKIYGITLAQFDSMLAAQNGVCAICRGTNLSGKRLHVDHDHKTGRFRGLLCFKCNGAIGLMADSPSQLRFAAEYLERD
jgi:hypothetical protein